MGTRVELLQKIESWIEKEDPNVPRIFWLSGLAGTGKYTIAQTVAERGHQRGNLGASFFSRNETDCGNPLLVFSTIAYQLAAFNSSFKLSIARALQADADIGRANIRTQLQKLIIEPLRGEVGAPSPVIVVMDAPLKNPAPRIFSDFWPPSLQSSPFYSIFFITSRPEVHIRSSFSAQAMRRVSQSFILHDIESSVVQGDIELFLWHRFAEITTTFFTESSWPKEEDLRALVEKAAAYSSSLQLPLILSRTNTTATRSGSSVCCCTSELRQVILHTETLTDST